MITGIIIVIIGGFLFTAYVVSGIFFLEQVNEKIENDKHKKNK